MIRKVAGLGIIFLVAGFVLNTSAEEDIIIKINKNNKPAVSKEAIIEAMEHRDIAVLKKAIEEGADVNAKYKFGNTLLMLAAEAYDGLNKARVLLENGAEVNAKDKFGNTALMKAASSNR